jgi:hypothetical protein
MVVCNESTTSDLGGSSHHPRTFVSVPTPPFAFYHRSTTHFHGAAHQFDFILFFDILLQPFELPYPKTPQPPENQHRPEESPTRYVAVPIINLGQLAQASG